MKHSQIEQWRKTCPVSPEALTILSCITGVSLEPIPSIAAPKTIEQFRSCRMVLEFFPESNHRFKLMANISQQWADLISFWDDLCVMQDLEQPDWRDWQGNPCKSPKTKLMLNTIVNRTNP